MRSILTTVLLMLAGIGLPVEKRSGLLFREDWKELPAVTPVTQEHVANPALTLHLYGPGKDEIKKSHHDQPKDDPYYIWSGECKGNWAVALGHRDLLVDLTGAAKIRWRSKQSGGRQLRIIVKLAEGAWLVSDQSDGPSESWRESEFKIAEIHWRALNIEAVTEGNWVEKPDLSRVDEIGFTDLMAGGRTPASSRLDWIEVWATARKRALSRKSPNTSSLVHPGKDGKLVYAADERGNRIPDFSHAGYGGGGIAIPDLPVKAEVKPGDGDDGARIQAAIDQVSKLPLDKRGWRGAVLLKKGRYEIARGVSIVASGVVLRGEGQSEDGTVLVATGTEKRILINVGGRGEWREAPGTRRAITDAYVPVGVYSFRVKATADLKVGDAIIVHRPSTAEWIHELGMDRIPPRKDGGRIEQWKPGTKDLLFDRVIAKINGNEVTVDAPICNALDQVYGGGGIYKYEFPARITQVGVENLRGVSEYKGHEDEDEAHAWDFIVIDAAANAWVRRITALHFAHNAVKVERKAKWVTVEDSTCLDPVSRVAGSRRYPFTISGQLTLVQRCFARNGRHDFAQGSLSPGPNVFLDCASEKSHSDTGPHHRWAAGALYDNVRVPDGAINIRNRSNLGSGHGWAGANMVLWNCEANSITCEQPPTAQNWAIGCRARERKGDGFWESFGQPVEPRSLYLKQLEDRLGAAAVEAVAGAAQTDKISTR
jgi:hypothetical protein